MYEWTARNGVLIRSEVPRREAWWDRFAITHAVWSWQFTARRVVRDWRHG